MTERFQMENLRIGALSAVSSFAILLGGIVYAQQEASPSPKTPVASPSSARSDGRSRSVRGWFPGREKPADESPESEIVSAPPGPKVTTPPPQSEAPFLKDLEEWLSVPIPKDATPGDIAFAIRQALSNKVAYSDAVLSDEAFEECCAAIPTTKDTETFKAYHAFITKVAGKRIVILTPDNK